MADVTVTARNPEELSRIILWAHKNDYKAHITQNTPSKIPDFDGDPVFAPWFEILLEDRSSRARELKLIVEQLFPKENTHD